jgi:clan AA aspartic protease
MMTGVVTSNREAVLRVMVRSAHGQESLVDAIIDTGFTGFLTLPAPLITTLALAFAGTTRAMLGDGSEVRMDIFTGVLIWDNQERHVPVLAATGDAFIGMSMLSGYRMTLDVEDGDSVVVEALP